MRKKELIAFRQHEEVVLDRYGSSASYEGSSKGLASFECFTSKGVYFKLDIPVTRLVAGSPVTLCKNRFIVKEYSPSLTLLEYVSRIGKKKDKSFS